MRTELDLIRDLYAYNSHVRKKYLETIFTNVPEEERKIDELVLCLDSNLRESDLDRKVTFTNDGGTEQITIRNMLVHMVEEELQHRGELNALLWQLDIDPPIIGFDDFMKT